MKLKSRLNLQKQRIVFTLKDEPVLSVLIKDGQDILCMTRRVHKYYKSLHIGGGTCNSTSGDPNAVRIALAVYEGDSSLPVHTYRSNDLQDCTEEYMETLKISMLRSVMQSHFLNEPLGGD